MSQDTENFDQLRRLLKLKRYEQPPPRYFNDLSSQVIARIKLGERGESNAMIDRLLWEAPWLHRIWAAFEAKPVLAGVCGVAICGLLVSGVIFSETTDFQPMAFIPTTTAGPSSLEVANLTPGNQPFVGLPAVFEASSTNPVAALPAESPFLGSLRAQPASFVFPARN